MSLYAVYPLYAVCPLYARIPLIPPYALNTLIYPFPALLALLLSVCLFQYPNHVLPTPLHPTIVCLYQLVV